MEKARRGYVAISDLAGTRGWPSRAALFAFVREYRVPRYRFPRDRRTYVRLSEMERAQGRPKRKG